MFVSLKGFAPDADPTEAGVLTDTDLMTPTIRGLKALPQGVDSGLSTGPSAVASMYAFKLNDGASNRLLVGTEGSASAAVSMLYEVTQGGWTDRGGAGSPYTATAAARWVFANYGDDVYAAQKGTKIQKSTGGAFTAVASASCPHASIIVPVLDFLVAFNVDDTETSNTYGNDPNRWHCSAAGDPDDWVPSIATQSATGLLTDTPGGITAAGKVGSNLVAFKERAAYLGQYIGAPGVWGWTQIPGEGMGAFSHYSVVDVEGVGLLFPGRDNFYSFDGSRAQPIGTNRVANFFLGDLDISNAARMIGYHDRNNWTVYWWYPDINATQQAKSGGAVGVLSVYLAYNYRSDKWTYGRKRIAFIGEYLEPGVTWAQVGDYYSTYDDLPNSPYDDLFGTSGTYRSAIVTAGSAPAIQKLEGAASNSYYTTGQYGKDGINIVLTRVRPRFAVAPSTGTQAHTYTDQLGSDETTSQASSTIADGAFDHVWAARWHRVKHSYTGDMEILGLDIEAKPDSQE